MINQNLIRGTNPPNGCRSNSDLVRRLVFGTAGIDLGVPTRVHLRTLEAAWDVGIASFDTAPVYAHGRAEEILGRFLSKRPAANVATKVGLWSRKSPAIPAWLFRGLKVLKQFKTSAKTGISDGASKNHKEISAPVDEGMDISRALLSFDRSKRLLRRDCIDRLMYHECSTLSANRAEVTAMFTQLRESNCIGQAGVCGGRCLDDSIQLSAVYDCVQTEFFLGRDHALLSCLAKHKDIYVYSALRPLRSIWERKSSRPDTLSLERILCRQVRSLEDLAAILVEWTLWKLPTCKLVFYSSKPQRILNLVASLREQQLNDEQLMAFEAHMGRDHDHQL